MNGLCVPGAFVVPAPAWRLPPGRKNQGPPPSPLERRPAAAMRCYLFYDSSANPNVRYVVRVVLADPHLVGMLEDGRRFALCSSLEYARLKAVKELALVRCTDDFPRGTKRVEMLEAICRELGVTELVLPASFPVGLYLSIRERFEGKESAAAPPAAEIGGSGPEDDEKPQNEASDASSGKIAVTVADTDDVIVARDRKTPEEQAFVRASNVVAAGAINLVREILTRSRIVEQGCSPEDRERLEAAGPHLYDPVENCIVTSEHLIKKMRIYCLQNDCELPEVIVSSGDDGVRVHFAGAGPVRPHSLIVVDVFPRSLVTGYWGDMTRTFLKGTATPAQRKQVATVRNAQLKALSMLRAGAGRKDIAMAVINFFQDAGFETGRAVAPNGEECFQGFFHGLSHGVGLAIHESPSINSRQSEDAVLEPGNVISVEPGLYYLGTGGCRWEDVVVITEQGYEMLSDCPYDWEIP